VKTRQFRKWLATLGMNPGALAVGNPAARLGVEEARMIRAPRSMEKVQIGLFWIGSVPLDAALRGRRGRHP